MREGDEGDWGERGDLGDVGFPGYCAGRVAPGGTKKHKKLYKILLLVWEDPLYGSPHKKKYSQSFCPLLTMPSLDIFW